MVHYFILGSMNLRKITPDGFIKISIGHREGNRTGIKLLCTSFFLSCKAVSDTL